MDRYGYLGPQGTFAEMALRAWPDAAGAEHVPFGSVDAALAAVRSGAVEAAMVPIENSVEGGVTATLDALAQGQPLVIIGEVLVPITFVLAARPGTALGVVRAIGTHSHAWAQVRGWAGAHLPDATYVPTLSTAASAADLAQADGDRPSYQGAVCAPVAADHYGLEVLAHNVGDNPNAVTRFVVVTPPGVNPAPTGTDKTTLVLFQKEDHAGGLLELLEQFAVRGINMTRLESRPTGESMGSYCFSVDIEGHVNDERVGECLTGLKRVCADIVFLGSYARADRGRPTIAPGNTDRDFVAAQEWLAALRGG